MEARQNLRSRVKEIADRLNETAAGDTFVFCGERTPEVFHRDDMGDEYRRRNPSERENYDLELQDLLDDKIIEHATVGHCLAASAMDIEWVVDRKGRIKHAQIQVVTGGPEIWVSTQGGGEVRGAWAGDCATEELTEAANRQVSQWTLARFPADKLSINKGF